MVKGILVDPISIEVSSKMREQTLQEMFQYQKSFLLVAGGPIPSAYLRDIQFRKIID